ncbi:translation initiation factor eIF-2B [Candidatus Woesearchaeota archaeon]|nr:translation initiation factor eIF-2B [Candidatus Woesearchaeota archaeon]
MTLQKTINDIKELKIQGAENIAKVAIVVLKDELHKIKKDNHHHILEHLQKSRTQLENTRPTEPMLKNTLELLFKKLNTTDFVSLTKTFCDNADKLLAKISTDDEKIASIGAKKIKNGSIIYTHCHSSTVMAILKKAKGQGKRFEVHCTETRPLFQGRKTAKELSNNHIKTTLFIDSAMRLAIKHCDMVLLGADAISTDKVYNKIGSELASLVAKQYDIPVYICTSSLKYDVNSLYGDEEPIEKRSIKELWNKAPKNKNLQIRNPAFEKINTSLITAIISDLGVLSHGSFIEEYLRKNI